MARKCVNGMMSFTADRRMLYCSSIFRQANSIGRQHFATSYAHLVDAAGFTIFISHRHTNYDSLQILLSVFVRVGSCDVSLLVNKRYIDFPHLYPTDAGTIDVPEEWRIGIAFVDRFSSLMMKSIRVFSDERTNNSGVFTMGHSSHQVINYLIQFHCVLSRKYARISSPWFE